MATEVINKVIKKEVVDIVQKIVDNPEEVDINVQEKEEEEDKYTQINIKVAKGDIPKCIGVQGATADALRRLTVLIARKHGYKDGIFLRVDAPPRPKNHFYN